MRDIFTKSTITLLFIKLFRLSSFVALLFICGCGRIWGGIAWVTPACSEAALVNSPYAGGLGSSASPYLICTGTQFNNISTNPQDWGSIFNQGVNIDLTGITITPIGTAGTNFTGTYNGQGFTISNFSYNNTATNNYGLFGYVSSPGTISNIVIASANITAQTNLGILAANFNGSMNNVIVAGSLVSYGGNAGGVIGQITGNSTLTNVISTPSINQHDCFEGVFGGIVGYITSGAVTISQSSYSGQMMNVVAPCNTNSMGGIVGRVNGGTVTVSYAKSSGTLNLGYQSGGLVGMCAGGTTSIVHSSSSATLFTLGQGGGAAGYGCGFIDRVFVTGTVTGVGATQAQIGGIIGWLQNNIALQNSYYLGPGVTGMDQIGGIVGLGNVNVYTNVYGAAASVTGITANVGGFSGFEGQGAGTFSVFTASYWDTDFIATGVGNGCIGVNCAGFSGQSTAQLQTYPNAIFLGWNTSIWNFINGFYPVLF